MNLKLVFRIYFGFGALMTMMMLVAPAPMLESYGMTLTNEIKLFTQFMVVAYVSLLIVTWMLPGWLVVVEVLLLLLGAIFPFLV